MPMAIPKPIADARLGTNPTVVCWVPSGWAVMADMQFLHGYIILLADPVVASINDLDRLQRAAFLNDMTLIGDALLEVTGAFRINYEILGNLDPALHAHIIPRYLSEPEELRKGPAFFYDKDFRNSIKFDYEWDKALMQQLAAAMKARL